MAIFRPNLTAPIPNNPFFYPQNTSLSSGAGPLIIGAGINVNYLTGVISASGGGGGSGTVTAVTGVSPVAVLNGTTTPQISVSNASTSSAGVVQLYDGTNSTSTSTALTANAGYLLQQQINNLSVSSNLTFAGTIDASTGNLATVTTEAAADGFVVGSPLPAPAAGNAEYYVVVTTAGTMTPPGGAAQACDQGDWWLSNGTIWQFINAGPTIPAGSLTQVGVVQLCAATNSTSTTVAATPSAVKSAFDLAAAAMPITGGTFTGPVAFSCPSTFNACAIFNCPITVNSTSTFCGNANYCCPATFGSTALFCGAQTFAGNSTFCCPVSFCCTPVMPPGVPLGCAACITYSNTVSGLAATNVQDAIDQTKAIASAAIPCAAVTAKGALITGTGAAAVTALPVGTDGQALVACSACSSGLAWISTAGGTVTNVSGTAPISVATGGTTPVVSIAAASTTGSGAVQLVNNTTTNDATMALTAAQGYAMQQQINSLLAGGGLTLAGTMSAATGLLLTVTASGSGAGFTVGAALPTPAAGNTDYFVIVTAGGSYSPPGGGGPYTASQGDWFLSNGSTYDFLNVGPEVAYATTTVAGTTCFATNAQTAAGTATNLSVTPAGLASAYIAKSAITAKGALITGSAASTPVALSVGANGQVLIADSTCASGLKWGTAAGTPQACPQTLGTVFGCTTSGGLTALGIGAANANPASNAVLIGRCAGAITTSAAESVGIGDCALCSLTTGTYNTTVGVCGMWNATTANFNTGYGWANFQCLLSGNYNTAIGWYAGWCVTSGCCNVLIGPYAVPTNPTDSCQLRIGYGNNLYWLCGDNTKAIQPAAGIRDCAGSTGTSNQVLLSNGANAICWGSVPGLAPATPSVFGTVKGRTFTSCGQLAYGCNALANLTDVVTYCEHTALGVNALLGQTGGQQQTAVGAYSMQCGVNGFRSVAIGTYSAYYGSLQHVTAVGYAAHYGNLSTGASFGNSVFGSWGMQCVTTGCYNTSHGYAALCALTSGIGNIALGANAGTGVTTGSCNVVLGYNLNAPVANGDCQLAIGFGGNYWLTGCSNKSIRPGAGIVDCAGTTGTAGQVLTSNGSNAVVWAASGGGAKQYMSAVTSACVDGFGLTTCDVNTWTAVASSGITLTSGTSFALTAGKTYRVDASLQWFSSTSATVNAQVALVNASTLTPVTAHRMYLLPITYTGANSQGQQNLSLIYTAPSNLSVKLRAVAVAGGSFQIYPTYSYITIQEI